jgi:asparagine synthase (glutamine-hydrolysing)
MSILAGVVSLNREAPDSDSEGRLEGAVSARGRGRTTSLRLGKAFFVRTAMPADRADESQIAADRHRHLLFGACARLDNRFELGAALGLSTSELAATHDAALISRMMERSGDEGLAQCLGAFAFAQWDGGSRRLTLVRDSLGCRAWYYNVGDGVVRFSTSIGVLLALPRVSRALDERSLANFLALNTAGGHRTFYQNIDRVPSRTLAIFDETTCRQRHYWTPNLEAAPPFRRAEDYIERARELFDQAVDSAVRDLPRVAIATSGGLDSSAIAATIARRHSGKETTCYTLVAPEGARVAVRAGKYSSERDKVMSLGKMYPSLDIRFIAPEDVEVYGEQDSRLFARANVPVLNPIIWGWNWHLYDAVAKAGHTAMLTGNLGNFGLSWHGRFSLAQPPGAGQWGQYVRAFRALARQRRHGMAAILAMDVLMIDAPRPGRDWIYRLMGRDPHSVAQHSALNPTAVAELGLLDEWKREGFDPWFGPRHRQPVGHRAFRLFDNNQFARDFNAMSGELLGFEIRDPHADRRLLEFALSVPEQMYREHGVPRSFARRVLADRLPSEIVDERRSGPNFTSWFQSMNDRRRDIAGDIERIEASPLASRLLDVPRLKRLMLEWPSDEHAAEARWKDYHLALGRGVHVGRFICSVEGGNR